MERIFVLATPKTPGYSDHLALCNLSVLQYAGYVKDKQSAASSYWHVMYVISWEGLDGVIQGGKEWDE